VRNLLKYFISVIFIAIAFTCGTHKFDVTVSERLNNDLAFEGTSYQLDSSTKIPDLDFSHQISYVNIFRLQNTTKRTNNAHKNNFEFVKTDKICSSDIRYSTQGTTYNIPFSSIRTTHRLIRLGKLII